MSWVLTAFQIIFLIFAIGISTEFYHGKDLRNFFGALFYGAAAVGSYYLDSWWPLVMGFVILQLIRKIGLDPTDDARR